MMKVHKWCIAVVLSTMAIGSVLVAAEASAREKKLSVRDISTLLSGKTLNGNFPEGIASMKIEPNGIATLTDRDGNQHRATWRFFGVSYCYSKRNIKEACYNLYDTGNGKLDMRMRNSNKSVGMITVSQ